MDKVDLRLHIYLVFPTDRSEIGVVSRVHRCACYCSCGCDKTQVKSNLRLLKVQSFMAAGAEAACDTALTNNAASTLRKEKVANAGTQFTSSLFINGAIHHEALT